MSQNKPKYNIYTNFLNNIIYKWQADLAKLEVYNHILII